MFQIELHDEFQASHNIRINGQWETSHTHNWRVRVFLSREKLDTNCVVADFDRVRVILRDILSKINNKDLNGIKKIGRNPTAEIIARYLYDEINNVICEQFCEISLEAVAVCEQPGCWAWYK